MQDQDLRVCVFGLGYVGSVSAACFAKIGWRVVGVDKETVKVDLINRGQAPIIENGLGEFISEGVAAGRLSATTDAREAVAQSNVAMVCVGTPSQANGNLDVTSIARVCEEIGAAIRDRQDFFVVVMRSTVLPGTARDVIIPILESASGKRAGVDFGLVSNPEFLREGTAVADFYNPPKTVVGASDEKSQQIVAALYAGIDAPLVQANIEVAEMIKYIDNAWHALKVAYANEIGNICKALSIDSHEVMDVFCQDRKLNLSSYYLKPGFAFGGSCLPKDVRALTYKARMLDLDLPVLSSILPSNRAQVNRAIGVIKEKGQRRVGVLGFSFKAGTDDLRESPMVELIEHLIGKGYELRLYDRNVNLARMMGANREYILKTIPHISTLIVDSVDEVLEQSDIVVIGNADPQFHEVPSRLNDHQVLIDMVRVPGCQSLGDRYHGINW